MKAPHRRLSFFLFFLIFPPPKKKALFRRKRKEAEKKIKRCPFQKKKPSDIPFIFSSRPPKGPQATECPDPGARSACAYYCQQRTAKSSGAHNVRFGGWQASRITAPASPPAAEYIPDWTVPLPRRRRKSYRIGWSRFPAEGGIHTGLETPPSPPKAEGIPDWTVQIPRRRRNTYRIGL